ncbi:MAG: CopG family transcriptional regulator [Bryobacterales bacterium]|nr:CopG family transcriptional regulator [Bryobacterales bacterium]
MLGGCYAERVSKKVTITLTEDVAQWLQKKAAEEKTSVSKLVARTLEAQMPMGENYWRAYHKWKKINLNIDASRRLSRLKAHAR